MAEAAAARRGVSRVNAHAEDFLLLRCNFTTKEGKPCSATVKEGWATSCSHLFCAEHANSWFTTDDRCPVCLDKQGRVRMVKLGSSKEKGHQLHTMLIGHNPCDSQLAATTAISFWTQQKREEFHRNQTLEKESESRVKRLVGIGRKQLAEAESLRQSLRAGTEELRHQLAEAQGRVHACKDDVRKLESRYEQVQRAYKVVLSKAVGLAPRQRTGSMLSSSGQPGEDLSGKDIPPRCDAVQRGASKDDFPSNSNSSAFRLERSSVWQRAASRSPRRTFETCGRGSAERRPLHL